MFYLIVIYLVVVSIRWDLFVNEDMQVILVTMGPFCYSPWNMESQGMFSCKKVKAKFNTCTSSIFPSSKNKNRSQPILRFSPVLKKTSTSYYIL